MPSKFDDIHDLVAAIELDNIVVCEERGRRLRWTDDELASNDFPMSTNRFAMGQTENSYRFRFRTAFADADAEYVADIEAVYVLPEEAEIAEDVVAEFASRVAFMAVYPFLRASIFGSAARMGLPIPVLGMVRQGDMTAGEQMTPEQVQEAFLDNRTEIATN